MTPYMQFCDFLVYGSDTHYNVFYVSLCVHCCIVFLENLVKLGAQQTCGAHGPLWGTTLQILNQSDMIS